MKSHIGGKSESNAGGSNYVWIENKNRSHTGVFNSQVWDLHLTCPLGSVFILELPFLFLTSDLQGKQYYLVGLKVQDEVD